MKFYRLQSKKYDINKNSKSWELSRDTWEEAAEDDIYITMYSDDEYYKTIVEKLENSEISVSQAWNRLRNRGYKNQLAQAGVSCFSNPYNLIEYYNKHGYGLENIDKENYYILYFEGQWVEEGCDGEDIVKFKREIERISIDDFLSKYRAQE